MRRNLALPILSFARLFLLSTIIFYVCLFSLSAKHLKAYNIENVDSPLATIQGRVWLDANDLNGILDADDPGLANVLVKLDTQTGTSQSILTDDQGSFEFSGLATGTYDLEFVNPLDYHFTAGSDSDADSKTGRIENIDINDSGTTVNGILVGVYQRQERAPSSIGLDMFEVSPNVLNGSPAVFVEWETSREEGTEGFYILRSSTDSRAQATLISELILSQGNENSTAPNRYEYWDTGTRQGNIYTYWLQEREIGGASAEYGPKFTVGVGPGNGDHPLPPPQNTPAQNNYVYLPLILK